MGGAPAAAINAGEFWLTFVILCVSMVYLLSLKHKEILIMLPQQSILFWALLLIFAIYLNFETHRWLYF